MSRPVACDRCRQWAAHEVFTDWGPLYFCGHHFAQFTPALREAGPDWVIHDFTSPYAYPGAP